MKNVTDIVEELSELTTLEIESVVTNEELLGYLTTFEHNDRTVQSYYNDKKNNFYYLRSSHLKRLDLGNRRNNEIVKLVENNGGKLTSAVASIFEQDKFLERFKNIFNNNVMNATGNKIEFSIEKILNDKEPYFLLDFTNSTLKLFISTKNFINDLGDIVFDRENANIDFKTYLLSSLNKFEVPTEYNNGIDKNGFESIEQTLSMQYDSNH